jgi:hypothetical protein
MKVHACVYPTGTSNGGNDQLHYDLIINTETNGFEGAAHSVFAFAPFQ